jgi:hypothetical protein
MNKQLILLGGGIFIATTLLVGVLWGWVSALAFVIGLSLFALIVLARAASLKFYLKTLSRRTMLSTDPLWAALYSFFYPHRRNQPSDWDDRFSSQRREESEES